MPKYVAPWNVGGMKKANTYYTVKVLTRKRRKKDVYQPNWSISTSLIVMGVAIWFILMLLPIAFG